MGAIDECRHGGLRRKCETCDLEEQLAASRERVRELERVIGRNVSELFRVYERAETAERERDEARKIAYVPGCWVCDTCDLVLVRQSFDPTTGEVGIAQIEDVPVCPNGEDHGTMRRQSWREHAEALEDSVESVCDERNEARRERDEAVARAEEADGLRFFMRDSARALSLLSNPEASRVADGLIVRANTYRVVLTRPDPDRSDAGGEEPER